MMIIIPFSYYGAQYVKKEDARELLQRQSKFFFILYLAISIVLAIIQFTVTPKLIRLYEDFNISLPLVTQISYYVVFVLIAICLCISLYFFFTPPNYVQLNKTLAKYKNGEMINIKEIISYKLQMVTLLAFGLFIGYIALSVIAPIYSLTNTF